MRVGLSGKYIGKDVEGKDPVVGRVKNYIEPIGNRTLDFAVCRALPQQTVLPRTPICYKEYIYWFI